MVSTVSHLGYQVVTSSINECIKNINQVIAERDRACHWLACLNPHSYAVARHDPIFSDALRQADWLVADGIGVVLGIKISGQNINNRITGSDIFSGVMDELNSRSGSVFFLGGTESSLQKIRESITKDYPKVRVSGTYSPPFKEEFSEYDYEEMVSMVNANPPDVLWVGMTAPKQEKFLRIASDRLQVSFAAAIGAVFDFYTGEVRRSPFIFRALGLEWLPRLIQQPRRLWKRMFVSAPIYLAHLSIQKWRSRGR